MIRRSVSLSPDLQVKAATMRRRDYLKITAALSDAVGGDRSGAVKPKPVEKVFQLSRPKISTNHMTDQRRP